jgi:predicted transcriptional regulator
MVSIQSTDALALTVGELMIPGEKVANVHTNNPLEHALLVLVKTGYSAVPVLDPSSHFKGIISKTMILEKILGIERFEVEKLSSLNVEEAMQTDIPTVTKEDTFLKGLKLVINHPFVCVVNQEGKFDGILTRRVILKKLNRALYE